jgi:iron complex outermembrane receptor protein
MSLMHPRAWLLATAASSLIVSAAHAQSTYRFDLPSQPLSEAVRSLGHQTGFNILVDSGAGEMIAPPLKGEMTVAEALKRLTAGRGVAVQSVDGRSFFISRAPLPKAGPMARSQPIVPTALQTPEAVAPARTFSAPVAVSPEPIGPRVQVDAAAPPAQADDSKTLTVTGSRIVRNGYSAPTPVTVATVADLLETTPTSIADALNKLPEFSPQFTAQSNTGAAAPGGNYLNLRGLGQGRTLVMLDGVRVPGTNTTGTVDTNTLPQALVQRVDVVTGGASAIYGSDAIGGVVNYILNTNFTGFKGSVQAGVSTYGDAPSNKISLAFGAHVLGKGHFEVSYEHSSSAALNQADRSYTANQPGYGGTGSAANPYVLYDNTRMATTTLGGYIQSATGATAAQTAALTAAIVNQQFVGTGTLAPFHAGAATGTLASATNTGGLQVGGDGAYVTGGQMVKPVDSDNLFARFDYDLGHNITAYAQVVAGLSRTNYFISPTALSTTVIAGNPYLPANVQTLLAANGTVAKPATFTLASLPQNFIQMQRTNQWASDLSATFGLKGAVFNDVYHWNASYTHGQGITHVENDNSINTSHFYAALDAVKDSSGNIVCNVSLTSSASLYPGCAPLNLIGQGNESAASLAYIMQNTAYDIINKTDDVSGSISGTAFNNWAGPVSVSANFEYRWASLTEDTDAAPAAPQLTGLRQTWTAAGRSAAPSTLFLTNTNAAQYGANSVWEVGGETVVPLLKDFPLVENLEFSGALRYTQYSISGPAITWKAGLSYQPIDDVRVRATESRDIRAPTLFELFQAPTATAVTVTDPLLNNLTYTVNQYAQGNTNVKPEVATTNTLGVIYSPSWFPRFRMSADYYLITIENVISQSYSSIGAGLANALTNCIASGGTSIYCTAVPRPLPLSNTTTANQITGAYNFPINLAEQYTRGLDLEASYGFDMRDIQAHLAGHTDLRVLATYSPTNVTITAPGAPASGSPQSAPLVTRVTATLNYSLGPLKVSWLSSYTDAHHVAGVSIAPTYYTVAMVPAVITDDIGISYRFKARGRDLQAVFNVTNIFNQIPTLSPPAPTNTPGAQSPVGGGVSPLGRYFTAGLRVTY